MNNPISADTHELDSMCGQIFFKKGDTVDQPDGKWTAKQDVTAAIWQDLQGKGFAMPEFMKYFERSR